MVSVADRGRSLHAARNGAERPLVTNLFPVSFPTIPALTPWCTKLPGQRGRFRLHMYTHHITLPPTDTLMLLFRFVSPGSSLEGSPCGHCPVRPAADWAFPHSGNR